MFALRQPHWMPTRLTEPGMMLVVLLAGGAALLPKRGGAVLSGSFPDSLSDVRAGAAIFKSECAVCHGRLGKGDGAVAVAMKPPPADLTDTARMARLSGDSLVQIITHGRRGMPAFKDDLTPQQVHQVIAFIRTLKP